MVVKNAGPKVVVNFPWGVIAASRSFGVSEDWVDHKISVVVHKRLMDSR